MPSTSATYVHVGWRRNVTTKVTHLRGYSLVGDTSVMNIQLPDQSFGKGGVVVESRLWGFFQQCIIEFEKNQLSNDVIQF